MSKLTKLSGETQKPVYDLPEETTPKATQSRKKVRIEFAKKVLKETKEKLRSIELNLKDTFSKGNSKKLHTVLIKKPIQYMDSEQRKKEVQIKIKARRKKAKELLNNPKEIKKHGIT